MERLGFAAEAGDAGEGVGLVFEAFDGDVLGAEETAAVGAGVDAALGFVEAGALFFEAAFAGEGHLLVLHGVEAREAANGDVGRDGLGLVVEGVELDVEGGEAGGDDGAVVLLFGRKHAEQF